MVPGVTTGTAHSTTVSVAHTGLCPPLPTESRSPVVRRSSTSTHQSSTCGIVMVGEVVTVALWRPVPVFVAYLYDGTGFSYETRQSYTACSSKSKEGLLLRLILWRSRGNSASALSTTVMLYQRESSPRWRRSRRSAPFSSWTGHQRILKCGVNRQPSTVVPGEDMAKVIRPSTCLNGDRESEEDAAVEGQCRTAHAKGACTHLSSALLLLPVCSDMCTCNQL